MIDKPQSAAINSVYSVVYDKCSMKDNHFGRSTIARAQETFADR